jgi:hypothetical protein
MGNDKGNFVVLSEKEFGLLLSTPLDISTEFLENVLII